MNTATEANTNTQNRAPLDRDWVEAHAEFLFNFAVAQVRDTNIAEDLVQETFLAGVRNHATFDGKSQQRTWLVGILRHKIYDHLRKTCRERAVRYDPLPPNHADAQEAPTFWWNEVAADSYLPCRRIELAEFRAHLEIALGKLPPRIAQVFQLYEIEERPNREVCVEMDISESNLWVMLHRARKQLRDHLGDWWFGAPSAETSNALLSA